MSLVGGDMDHSHVSCWWRYGPQSCLLLVEIWTTVMSLVGRDMDHSYVSCWWRYGPQSCR